MLQRRITFTLECPILAEKLTLENACLARSRQGLDSPYTYSYYSQQALTELTPWRDPLTRSADFEYIPLNRLTEETLQQVIERHLTHRTAQLKTHEALSSPALQAVFANLAWQAKRRVNYADPNPFGRLFPNVGPLLITPMQTELPRVNPQAIPTLEEHLRMAMPQL